MIYNITADNLTDEKYKCLNKEYNYFTPVVSDFLTTATQGSKDDPKHY